MKFFLLSLLILFTISCDTKQNQVENDLKEIAKEVMVNAKNCALITVDSLGVAHVRTMDAFLPEDDFTVWMGTNSRSLKVKQIQNNNKVSLYYFDEKSVSYVTLQGTAIIVNDNSKKEIYWKKEWKKFYKSKTTDYLLIKFIPSKGNLISEKYNVLGDSMTWETPKLNLK